jgi:transcriptional regulator with XRE-family HTH domain
MKNELEQRWRDLGEFIRDRRRLGNLSLRKLSEMADVSNPYLSQIERGLRKPSAEILQQLARALHISAETLYVRAGILDAPEDGTDLTDTIRRDPYLTDAQKKTLVTVYESFRLENGNLGDGPGRGSGDGPGRGSGDGPGRGPGDGGAGGGGGQESAP